MERREAKPESRRDTLDLFVDDCSLGLFSTQERNVDLEMQDDEMDDNSCSRTDSCVLPEEKEQVDIAASETKQVLCLRATLTMVVVLVASFVCFAVYRSGTQSEKNEFESYARETCEKVTSGFQSSSASRLTAIASLAKSISSNAAAQGLTWPNVTVPDFEERLTLTMELAEVMSLILLPLVTGENLYGWHEYSVSNQGWFNQSLEYQKAMGTNHSQWQDDLELMESLVGSSNPDNSIAGEVVRLNSNVSATPEEGPFLPWWQFAPVFPVSSIVNFDTFSHPSRQHQLEAVLMSREALVSDAWDYSDTENPATYGKKIVLNLFLRQWQNGGKRYQDGPVSDLYFPVFGRTASRKEREETEVAAILTAYVYWQVYFEDVLPPHSEPVVAVLENICGDQDKHHGHNSQHHRQLRKEDDDHKHQQQFSYLIRGETAEYLGPGDLHDTKFNYLGTSTDHHAFLAGTTDAEDLMEGQCIYRVQVYPTQEMQDNLSTLEPLVFMLIVLASFAMTSLIFVVYDYYVEHRQEVVLTKAIKSTEVVHTLFPENVRSRLFEDSSSGNHSSHSKRRMGSNPKTITPVMDPSLSIRSAQGSNGPIVADLHEECTVLFADLAGFTKWSHNREPTEIFRLLEALYGAFDRIANRRRVFKVETIGDCYLAITGVPCPQKDHAVIMVKFGYDCIEKMDHLIHSKLASQLGEDTRNLKLRVGIHSGPVTAGVLRGERARFQLFGDTVNTASRMESLSLPGKIQVSNETAALLREAMKGAWLFPREGGVEAKGKGTLATFWVHPRQSTRSRLASSVSTGGFSGESDISL